jgi:hypothetical protein
MGRSCASSVWEGAGFVVYRDLGGIEPLTSTS